MESLDPDVYSPDATDLAIINLLLEDGRLSAAEIAARISGISERTVRNRLNALIERSLIRVGALPDPTALGRMVYADVMIQVEPGKIIDVARRLVDYDCVNYFVSSHVGNLPHVRKTNTTVIPIILKTFGYKTRDFERLTQARPAARASTRKRK